jgi:hypothetical protein
MTVTGDAQIWWAAWMSGSTLRHSSSAANYVEDTSRAFRADRALYKPKSSTPHAIAQWHIFAFVAWFLQGAWQYQFTPSSTYKRAFTTPANKEVQVRRPT